MPIQQYFRSDDFSLTTRSPWFSSFLVSSNPYQRNHDRNHKLWNLRSTERYILHKFCPCSYVDIRLVETVACDTEQNIMFPYNVIN